METCHPPRNRNLGNINDCRVAPKSVTEAVTPVEFFKVYSVAAPCLHSPKARLAIRDAIDGVDDSLPGTHRR